MINIPPSTAFQQPSPAKETKSKKPNTINEKHIELLELFEKNETEKIPKLLKEIRKLKRVLISLIHFDEHTSAKDKIVLTPIPPPNVTNIDKYLETYERIMEKKAEIKEMKMKKKKYYLENAKCIFHYFEQKKTFLPVAETKIQIY